MSEETIGLIAFWIFVLLILVVLRNWEKGGSETTPEVTGLPKKLAELEEKRQANERTPQRVPAPMLDAEGEKHDRT